MQETITIASHIGTLGANIKNFFLFIIVENFLFCHLLTEERKSNISFFYDLMKYSCAVPFTKILLYTVKYFLLVVKLSYCKMHCYRFCPNI